MTILHHFGLMKISAHDACVEAIINDLESEYSGRLAERRREYEATFARMRSEKLQLQNQIAMLNGKLVHSLDNPEPAQIAVEGLRRPKSE